ncbi:pyridoxamine 5'-phosphate oxidase family protein [Xylanimonas oleitrophica]|uniref:Pyridoxamine 5'-phosphate oxidase family protein n=1 Tax=Xylanimonas oleitrophica TaxID=2607479 RepID=A0A2W5WNP0_9MICO|nr:pyridoxamine 5'-phosphate oxidase family protein [Xylanimonas oleitrophica]PZR52602.1 pyridoxamine 5'-phosphate oxidase family protein [Xylanimonas oleitrophica]
MSDPTSVVTPLSEDEAWELLGLQPMGRLATAVAGEPEIFPVNHAVAGRRVYVRTSPGSKLAEIAINGNVAFEVDQMSADLAYSVVVKGTAEILEKDADLTEAEATGLITYDDLPKNVWLRITPREISGRRFAR